MERNTQFSFYKSKPYKNTRLQRPKDLEHAKKKKKKIKKNWHDDLLNILDFHIALRTKKKTK